MYVSLIGVLFRQYTSSGKGLPKVELTSDMCAVCGQRIILPTEDESVAERTYRLTCNHLYPLVDIVLLVTKLCQ